MELKLPETLILSVTVHGVIDIEGVDVAQFTVPEGLRVTKVSAVSPGVCNMMSPDDVTNVTKAIKKSLGSPGITYDGAKAKLPELVKTLKSLQTAELKDIRVQIKSERDQLGETYLNTTDRGYSVEEYVEGKTMINKMFAKNEGEGADHASDFKITVHNLVDTPDLFSFIMTGRLGATTTRASSKAESTYGLELLDLLHFVKNGGARNIILIDFSCSEIPDATERTKRVVRLRLAKLGIKGGRKTRRRNNKTKSRRQKKRKASWTH